MAKSHYTSKSVEQICGYSTRTVRYRIHKYYQEAGIRKKASVHTLRHTFATHQIHNGLKINQLKEVLGHRKVETTYKYVHLDRTNLRAEMEPGA
jgi:integrase/recombinase XerD